MLAKSKNYVDAQKIKNVADIIEQKELEDNKNKQNNSLKHQLKKLSIKHDCKLFALKKRTKIKREEHNKRMLTDKNLLIAKQNAIERSLINRQKHELKTQSNSPIKI